MISDPKHSSKTAELLLTPPMPSFGLITSEGYNAAWTASDLGNSAECTFEATFDTEIPKDVVLHLNDRNGSRMAELSKASPKANLSCYDMADGNLLLVRLPSGFLNPTEVLATFNLVGMNGHSMFLSVDTNN